MADDEDEVFKRARLAAQARSTVIAARETRDRLRTAREREMSTGLADLLNQIAQNVAAKTSSTIALGDDKVVCFVGTDESYVETTLFRAEVGNDSDELDDDDWELSFNCEASSTLNAEEDFPGDEAYGLSFESAVEFGVEAVLDGLAVELAQGRTIADAKRILTSDQIAPPETVSTSAPISPTPARRGPRLFGPSLALLALAGLLVYLFSLAGRI